MEEGKSQLQEYFRYIASIQQMSPLLLIGRTQKSHSRKSLAQQNDSI